MILTRFKKVLLVAPNVFLLELLADYKNIRHISATNKIFPSIYEMSPDVIVFDFEFMGKELENTLRRLKVNPFYKNVKICCFKNIPNDKADNFLKVLGVDQFIYRENFKTIKGSRTILTAVNSLIDASIIKLTASISN